MKEITDVFPSTFLDDSSSIIIGDGIINRRIFVDLDVQTKNYFVSIYAAKIKQLYINKTLEQKK